MRIGELSKRSGLSRDTLRHYERQGLVRSRPGPDPSNNYRDYPEDNLITLEQVADAQAAGMSLSDLVRFMAQLDAEDPDAFDGVAFLDARIREVDARISRAQRFLDSLRRARDALAQPEGRLD